MISGSDVLLGPLPFALRNNSGSFATLAGTFWSAVTIWRQSAIDPP